MKKYYPVMLDITGKKCVIIGGGKVASRKAASLITYGAEITVISKEICPEIKELLKQGLISRESKNYYKDCLKNAYIVFAATDNPEINQLIASDAKNLNISANIADAPELCSFMVPAKLEQGDLTIAISTNGKSPGLAKKIRQDLEKEFDIYYSEFLDLLGYFREKSLKELPDQTTRETFLNSLIYSDALELLKLGKISQVKENFENIFKNYKNNRAGNYET